MPLGPRLDLGPDAARGIHLHLSCGDDTSVAPGPSARRSVPAAQEPGSLCGHSSPGAAGVSDPAISPSALLFCGARRGRSGAPRGGQVYLSEVGAPRACPRGNGSEDTGDGDSSFSA